MLFLSTLPARGATAVRPVSRYGLKISIHAPREGSDCLLRLPVCLLLPFLSTLPARGATHRYLAWSALPSYFYPRSPRGERRVKKGGGRHGCAISIHAPREGSDGPLRLRPLLSSRISIHAPREGSDLEKAPEKDALLISIHAPREGSDVTFTVICALFEIFLSTLPARGATFMRLKYS